MCFVGLQGSYVTWGFIQEKVMTQRYETGMFPSTVFLVCANRALALARFAASVAVFAGGGY